jgi:hypothetical protein
LCSLSHSLSPFVFVIHPGVCAHFVFMIYLLSHSPFLAYIYALRLCVLEFILVCVVWFGGNTQRGADPHIGALAGRSSFPSRYGAARATYGFIWLGTLSSSSDLLRSSYSQPVSVASRPRTTAISVMWTSLPHIDRHFGKPILAGGVDRRQGISRVNEDRIASECYTTSYTYLPVVKVLTWLASTSLALI